MAGLLYLPRLFVYHWSKEVGSDSSETFKLMELRLLKIIMNPAMIFSWLFGLALISTLGIDALFQLCLLYTSPSPRDLSTSRMPSSA